MIVKTREHSSFHSTNKRDSVSCSVQNGVRLNKAAVNTNAILEFSFWNWDADNEF